MALHHTYRISHEGEYIESVVLNAFINNGGYHLADVEIYRDGMIECWGMSTFEEFKQNIRSGLAVTRLPPDAEVRIFPLGSFKTTNASYWIRRDILFSTERT